MEVNENIPPDRQDFDAEMFAILCGIEDGEIDANSISPELMRKILSSFSPEDVVAISTTLKRDFGAFKEDMFPSVDLLYGTTADPMRHSVEMCNVLFETELNYQQVHAEVGGFAYSNVAGVEDISLHIPRLIASMVCVSVEPDGEQLVVPLVGITPENIDIYAVSHFVRTLEPGSDVEFEDKSGIPNEVSANEDSDGEPVAFFKKWSPDLYEFKKDRVLLDLNRVDANCWHVLILCDKDSSTLNARLCCFYLFEELQIPPSTIPLKAFHTNNLYFQGWQAVVDRYEFWKAAPWIYHAVARQQVLLQEVRSLFLANYDVRSCEFGLGNRQKVETLFDETNKEAEELKLLSNKTMKEVFPKA